MTESRYCRLVEGIPAVTYEAPEGDGPGYISPQIQSVLGVTAEEWQADGQAWARHLHPDDCARVMGELAGSRAAGAPFRSEYRLCGRDGRVVWVHDEAAWARAPGGAPLRRGVMLDVTERKEAERVLAERERRYRRIAQNAADVIWTTDLDLRPTFVSPAVTPHLGYTIPEALAMTAADVLAPASLEVARQAVAMERERDRGDSARAWSRTLPLEWRRRDGSTLWMEVSARFLRDAAGHPVGVLGISRDIRGRMAGPERAGPGTGRYRRLSDGVIDVIAVLDMDLGVTFVTPSIRRLQGLAPEEAMAQTMAERLTPASHDLARRALAEELAAERAGGADPGRSRTLELELRRPDGSTVWTEARMSFVRDAAGQPVAIVGVIRDITERRRLDEMKADFVTLTTHQLRTPLGGIKWLLEVAAEAPELSDDTRAQIEGARQSADRLSEMVNNLLDAAQLETGTLRVAPEPTCLDEITRSVVDELRRFAREKGVELTVGAEAAAVLDADPRWLRQAILNLVSNAIKYTPRGGTIAIRATRVDGRVRWEIRDTGIGIPRDAQPRLFEKFYRARNASIAAPEGTGLGLYLARLIVERFGGRIWCESEAGRGATFAFTLPVAP